MAVPTHLLEAPRDPAGLNRQVMRGAHPRLTELRIVGCLRLPVDLLAERSDVAISNALRRTPQIIKA